MNGKLRPPHQFEIGDRVRLNWAGKEAKCLSKQMKANPDNLGPVVGFKHGCVVVLVRTLKASGKRKPRQITLPFRPEHLELVPGGAR